MKLYNIKSWDLYQNKSRYKILILIIALIIGGASIIYTQTLVDKLAEREQKLIDLYAKGLINAVEAPSSGSLTFLFQEIIEANNSIPVILTDENFYPLSDRNISIPKRFTEEERIEYLRKEVSSMRAERPPIVVQLAPGMKNYIFYKNSFILRQLFYYPYIQLTIISILAIIAYLAFSYSRNAEQNRVWVGLAKETAHQLGTPISSLMAWVELMKIDPRFEEEAMVAELEKDIDRLEMITARFSNIGSLPSLNQENITEVIEHALKYLRSRVSPKVELNLYSDANLYTDINRSLFEWVIENMVKNAVDAMNSKGRLDINIQSLGKQLAIDISDTGKGIAKSNFKNVFKPGYTTRKRGWGLGLTLVKRIIENYHQGKIMVLKSAPGEGTTFRILLGRK
jgi:two-component system, sporulation sensor kinase E